MKNRKINKSNFRKEVIKTAKIKAFGKTVNREKAYRIIIDDKLCDIVYANNTDSLKNLLISGWKPLKQWTNMELEDFIGTLSVENQRRRNI